MRQNSTEQMFVDWCLPICMIGAGGVLFLLTFTALFFNPTNAPLDRFVQSANAIACLISASAVAVGVIWIGVLPIVFAVRRLSEPPR